MRQRHVLSLLLALSFAVGGCPKKDDSSSSSKESKDSKKKSDDDDDGEKKKKKKSDDDDDSAKKKKKTSDDDDDDSAKKKKKTSDDDDDSAKKKTSDDDDSVKKKKKAVDDDDDSAGKTPPPVAETAALFGGTYSSNWGTTVFTQTDQKVTGKYPLGILNCTVYKDVNLACGWVEGASTGRAFLTRIATSGVLTGSWGNGASASNGGAWTFTPVKPK